MHAMQHRDHRIQPGHHFFLTAAEQPLGRHKADQGTAAGRHIQPHGNDTLFERIKGGVGFHIQQRAAGKPFALLAHINRDHVILFGIRIFHQLHSADDGYFVFTGAAAVNDTQLNFAHFSSPLSPRCNGRAGRFHTSPHRLPSAWSGSGEWPHPTRKPHGYSLP